MNGLIGSAISGLGYLASNTKFIRTFGDNTGTESLSTWFSNRTKIGRIISDLVSGCGGNEMDALVAAENIVFASLEVYQDPGTTSSAATIYERPGNYTEAGYVEGSYDFNDRYWRWGPKKGVGINATFQIKSNVNVYEQSGNYYANIFITGETAASHYNKVTWYGSVDLYNGDEIVSSITLNKISNSLFMGQQVGGATVNLPMDLGKNVYLRVNSGYYISSKEGILSTRMGRHKFRLKRYFQGFVY